MATMRMSILLLLSACCIGLTTAATCTVASNKPCKYSTELIVYSAGQPLACQSLCSPSQPMCAVNITYTLAHQTNQISGCVRSMQINFLASGYIYDVWSTNAVFDCVNYVASGQQRAGSMITIRDAPGWVALNMGYWQPSVGPSGYRTKRRWMR